MAVKLFTLGDVGGLGWEGFARTSFTVFPVGGGAGTAGALGCAPQLYNLLILRTSIAEKATLK